MSITDTLDSRKAVGIAVLTCAIPYYVRPRTLPDASVEPFDIIWMAEYTFKIAVEGMSIFTPPDPWLRYIPQTFVLWLLSLVTEVSMQDAIFVNAQYTIFVEAVLTPLAIYWLARTVYSRPIGVIAVFTVALLQYPDTPWVPGELIIKPMFYGPHWQYAFAVPWMIAAFTSVVRLQQLRERGTTHPSVNLKNVYRTFAGICLGVAGSIQIVQAGIAAFVVALAYVHAREWRSLVVTAGVSMLVASPNLIIVLNYPSRWFRQGVEKSTPQGATFGPEYTLLFVGLLVVPVAVAAFGPAISHRRSASVSTPDESFSIPVVAVYWLAVTFGLTILLSAADSFWYRYHSAYLLKYAVVFWVTAVVAVILRNVGRFVGERESE